MLVADTRSGKSSEVLWEFSEEEQFNFDNAPLVLVRNGDEVSALQLGSHEILGSIRTDFYHKKLLSGRVFPEKEASSQHRLLCYLLDTQTACLLDLNSKMNICLIEHDAMITGLQLDPTGWKVLFKDSNSELHLFDARTKTKVSLARTVRYWGWVPDSDVVVCHCAETLRVWYSSDHLQNWTSYPAKGRLVRLLSEPDGQTSAVFLDGNLEKQVELDSVLIRFNFALKRKDFGKCLAILGQDHSPESAFHWKNLLKVALEHKNYFVVEKCYAATGDYSKREFFRNVNKLQRKGKEHSWEVKVELALLSGQYRVAENLLLERGMGERAMEVFQDMHRWQDAIRLARQTGQAGELERQFVDWLLESGQNLKAAEMLLDAGQVERAVELFTKEGLPGVGAKKMLQNKIARNHSAWTNVENACETKGLYWVLGEIHLYRDKRRKALNAFIKGNHFAKAVQLARKEQPEIVVGLHEKWGDWLRGQGELEEAVHHFIEARSVIKAVESSLDAGDWAGAIRLAEGLRGEEETRFRADIGRRLRERGHYSLAEKQLVKAGLTEEAVKMWLSAGRFTDAERLCKETRLQQKQTRELFCAHAESMAEEGRLEDAEKVFLSLSLSDEAIRMYKRHSRWADMLRLFKRFRRENLADAHVLIGRRLEAEKDYAQAEEHFLRGGNWRLVLAMYESNGMVGESLRVLREFGTPEETTGKLEQYERVEGPQPLEKLLRKMHMSDVLVDYLCSKLKFSDAFAVAENARHKLEQTHLRYGQHLANSGDLVKAEEEFAKVNRWDVAVQMYLKLGRFTEALRVAAKVGPESVKAVHRKRGDSLAAKGDFAGMEASYVEAGQPDNAIAVYLRENMLAEALRVAKKFCRSRVKEIMERTEIRKQNMDGQQMLRHARLLEDSAAYAKAVDVYLAMDAQQVPDAQMLVGAWEKAVQLAFSHDKERYATVVESVAGKLENIGKFDLAGYYFENVGNISKAVENFLRAGDIPRAQAAAERDPNPRERERLLAEIRDAHRSQLESRQDAEMLLRNQQIESGVRTLVQRQDWERALSVSKNKNPDLFRQTTVDMLRSVGSANPKEALRLLCSNECDYFSGLEVFIRELARNTFESEEASQVADLRRVLRQLLRSSRLDNNLRAELAQLEQVSHLLRLRHLLESQNAYDLAARVRFSLLRFVGTIPSYKAFFQAGQALKRAGMDHLGFVVLNVFLDMYEAVEEGCPMEVSDQCNLDLLDIPSLEDITLPEKNFISKEQKNQIRDWLLSVSSKYGTDLCLPKQRCSHCGASISEKCLSCPKCLGLLGDMCILSGEVIGERPQYECPSCHRKAAEEHLQKFRLISTNCPWCDQVYLE